MTPHRFTRGACSTEFRHFIASASIALLTLLPGFSTTVYADAQFGVVASFDATTQGPAAPLIQAADGNFYGTSFQGGAAGAGSVFQLTPAGAVTMMYAFTGGVDGGYPYAGVIQGTDGNFYGTTSQGGAANAGTVFSLTPDRVLTTLYAFSGGVDGGYPYAGLVLAADGNFYGTTSQGGAWNAGAIFEITPAGALSVLYSFAGMDDGAYPYAGLMQGADGNFSGAAYQGGASGAGTIFRLTPDGIFSVLYPFSGGSDGAYPFGAVIQGTNGNLYGVTTAGGDSGLGTVFALAADGAFTTLHAFTGGVSDGSYPIGGLVQDTDGNFYGTTFFGGPGDVGTLYQTAPDGMTTILHAFTGGSDGAYPYAPLVQASDGDLYGTAVYGGDLGGGSAYRVSTAPSLVTWTTPAPIVYGTRLGAAQLNATASVPGVFVYSPPAGTLLHAGSQTLTVLFTPADASIAPAASSVTLTVLQAQPLITWTPPSPISYGTPLDNTQLRARANVSGTFVYDPPAGFVPGVGTQTLSATFFPVNGNDYAVAVGSVSITVTAAMPVVSWYPAALAIGMALGPSQLNATANTSGVFTYTPGPGTVLDAGTQTLTATFTPDDAVDFIPASVSATVAVETPGTSGGGNRYPLQFTPAAGARGLVVAGYALLPDQAYDMVVIGNCSYYTVHSGSGRGGGYKTITTYYNQTCQWDLYGNLLSVRPGAPVAPAPVAVNGTQTIYATTPFGIYTGTDSSLPGRGFVYTPGSHYTWLTSNAYAVIQQARYSFVVALTSDGDMPLTVYSVEASALAGQASVSGTTCNGAVAVGSTCTATVIYDPTRLRSATGLSYDTLNIHVNSDAGPVLDFTERYTIVLTSRNTTD